MNRAPALSKSFRDSRASEIILPLLLSFALIAILLPLPRPEIPVNHPYKVELLLSIFLMAGFVLSIRNSGYGFSSAPNTIVRFIAAAMCGFAFWSGASVLWGTASLSVVHHTLLWSMYVVFFVAFSSVVRSSTRFFILTFVIVSLITGVLCVVDYAMIRNFADSELTLRLRYAKPAELFVTLSPVLWAAAIYARKRSIVLLVAAFFAWATASLSLSKGAFIAGVVGFSIFFVGSAFFAQAGFRKKVVTYAAVWLVLTVVMQTAFSTLSGIPSTTNYITGSADPSRTSSIVRLFIWKVGQQMAADHWLIGVGADNFGMRTDEARARYRDNHPTEPPNEIGEDFLLERAHNEPLEVMAELGIVGLFLFLLPLAIFGVFFVRHFLQRPSKISVMLWASVSGMAAFLISSQFSSFSFRSAQNGIVFFMVFAIAANELNKLRRRESRPAGNTGSSAYYLIGVLVTLLMIVFCASKLIAEYQVYMVERSQSYSEARSHLLIAETADPEYAGAYLTDAAWQSSEGKFADAAERTQKAIHFGLGLPLTYSRLIKHQIAAGDIAGGDLMFYQP